MSDFLSTLVSRSFGAESAFRPRMALPFEQISDTLSSEPTIGISEYTDAAATPPSAPGVFAEPSAPISARPSPAPERAVDAPIERAALSPLHAEPPFLVTIESAPVSDPANARQTPEPMRAQTVASDVTPSNVPENSILPRTTPPAFAAAKTSEPESKETTNDAGVPAPTFERRLIEQLIVQEPTAQVVERWLVNALPPRRSDRLEPKPIVAPVVGPSSDSENVATQPALVLPSLAKSAPHAKQTKPSLVPAVTASSQRTPRKQAEPDDDAAAPQATIEVTIGRIEIRAEVQSAAAASPKPKPVVMTLDEYLRRRRGGGA